MSDELREAIARAMAKVASRDASTEDADGHYTVFVFPWEEFETQARTALDAIKAAGWVVVPKEPVGVAGEMPGSNGGFSMGVFKATEVPLGSQLFALQPETD